MTPTPLTPRSLSVMLLCALAASACVPPSERPAGSADLPDLERFEAGELQFPGSTWVEVDSPGKLGWSEAGLEEVWSYVEEELETAAVMIVHRGVLIDSWGELSARYNGQSMRKAMLGAMIGQEVEEKRLRLDATLDEIGLDDDAQPLSEREKSASLADLLQSRSGIYLSALYEAGGWKRRKPERGSHAPGEAWFYNNWGFNALGTLFERSAGATIHEAFAERIAGPIGMEDYRPKDVHYVRRGAMTERMQKNDSEHAAYVFMTSTQDMARFGLLYLAGGRWAEEQVVPAGWVEKSVSDTVETLPFLDGDRWGYLWWVSPPESALGRAIGHASYKATGGRGHKVVVVPDLDLVVVHRLAVGGVGLFAQLSRRFGNPPSVKDRQFGELMRRIVAAHPAG